MITLFAMKNKTFFLAIIMISFLSCKTETKPNNDNIDKSTTYEIDSLGNRYLELNRFSGVILITKDGTTIYNNSFGLADYENKTPFSAETAFKIGKISEVVTANIIGEIVEKGKLKLSDKISKHIPEVHAEFTIDDLLNHQTNLPNIQTIKKQNPELEYSTVEYTNLATQSSVTSKNSDLDYNILGLLLEKISGKSFQLNIENYSKNLGLENTYFQKPEMALAVGYLYHNYQGNGLELQKSPISNSEITFSSNGLKSTANDLSKIIKSNSNHQLEIDGYLENDGFSYSIESNPKTKTVIIVLSNRRHPVATEISNSIESILQNKKYRLPLKRKPYDIDKKLLKEYSGSFSLNESRELQVINENDSLFVMMGQNQIHLIPQSSNQFYMKQMDASIRFLKDSTNTFREVVLLDGFLEGNKIKRTEK